MQREFDCVKIEKMGNTISKETEIYIYLLVVVNVHRVLCEDLDSLSTVGGQQVLVRAPLEVRGKRERKGGRAHIQMLRLLHLDVVSPCFMHKESTTTP